MAAERIQHTIELPGNDGKFRYHRLSCPRRDITGGNGIRRSSQIGNRARNFFRSL